MSFAPQTEAFAVTAAETAVVGDGIGEANGEKYKYTGVNSMVGTLISWNGDKGGYISHPIKQMSSVWVIDNKGEMVNGANSTRCPPINFYSKKNDNLSAVKLIKGINATPDQGTTVAERPNLYKGETFDNIVTGNFNGQSGVKYFTVGGTRADDKKISSDWAKAIFAASLYSDSGILNNDDFGGAKAEGEYPSGWVSEFQTQTGGNYVTKFGTPFNEKLLNPKNPTDGEERSYTYIAIKLESDWTATDVSEVSDAEYKSREAEEPIGLKAHIGRLSNSVADNNAGTKISDSELHNLPGDTLIPLGTTFDANYAEHSKDDVGDIYLNSQYKDGVVNTDTSTEKRALSDRIKAYANIYNKEIRTQQLTFCPAGEGYSFGRLAIPDNAYVILDLNGHTIDRALNNNAANVDTIVQSVFMLGQYSRLEVFDSSVSDENPFGRGEVKGGYTKNGTGKVFDNQIWDNYGSDSNYANAVKGGGFTLRNRAELTVHSGNVTNNQGLFGGAFYGVGASTVNVFDANIEGNSAVRGGMCYLSQGSFMTLNMFGGLVQGNSARMDGFAENNGHKKTVKGEQVDVPRRPSVTDPTAETDDGIYDTKQKKNPDGYGHEGGGICVYQESYCNIYGGTIAYNYSATFGGGISVSYNSFLKLFGGEITGNVAKGLMRDINGATITPDRTQPSVTKTPNANVGGAGINMYQDSAGIYLNGPAKVTGNYCSQVEPEGYTTEAIAALIENDEKKEDSNLYLSLTTSMARYSWNTDHYDDSKTRYNLTGEWDEAYGPTFKTGGTAAGEGQAVSRKGQMKFDSTQHLYPEIKVQGPLYKGSKHFAQVSITPAAGIEAGGYIMRQFLNKGWEDSASEQTNKGDGKTAPKWLGEDEKGHAKDQIGEDGTTAFNVSKYLSTGATTGYVDGFLFTDGGTSIVEGTGDNEGWYLALGTKDASNLPVEWQYYDNTLGEDGLPKGWTKAETTAETGTGFSLVYNGQDRKYNIRVRLDRTELVGGTEESHLSKYFYLYYDYYTTYSIEPDGSFKEGDTHYYYEDGHGGHANILEITSGHYLDGEKEGEPIEQTEAKYASEKYDRLGYRFTINEDIKNLKASGGDSVAPFNSNDQFHANPNYATMKIERATLMISQLTLTDIDRYYDGTTDFYVKSDTLSAGEITGYAPEDQTHLRMQFVGIENDYVKGKLQSPNVGTTNVALSIYIEEVGRGDDHTHNNHTEQTFPNECLLLNYKVYDQNSGTTTDAEDKGNIPVTLNVNVKPKPITVELEKQSYEYGSVPMFGSEWGTHANTANWAETYGKAKGGASLEALFKPKEVPDLGQEGFDPDALGLDGKLAQVDIDNENVDSDHGVADKTNLPLRLDQILKISFTSAYMERSSVGTYGGTFNYTNTNYAVTWVLGEQKVESFSGSTLQPATIENLIEITKRRIVATVSDAASIYGEAQATLTLLSNDVKHIDAKGAPLEGDDGVGIVFGDTLNETLGLTSPVYTATTKALRVTRDAAGNPVNGDKTYYDITITNKEGINSNYELVTVTPGKYTVYPRKIKLTAQNYNSVYGDDVDAGMGGYEPTLADTQFGSGLDITSTVIFESDRTAFGKGISYAYNSEAGEHKNKGDYKFNVKFDHTKATEKDEDIGINYDVSYGADATHTIEARKVTVLIYSPNEQQSEYGEAHKPIQGAGVGIYWRVDRTDNGRGDPVVKGDTIKVELYLDPGINEKTPAGTYPIMGRCIETDALSNYEVDFAGSWAGNENINGYDTHLRAGTYTITRRNVSLNISTSLTSEYGDDLVTFWDSRAYSFTRTGGGTAVLDGDSLALAASLFSLNIPGRDNIKGGGDVTFAATKLTTGNYTILFDITEYRNSEAYNAGANANYEISVVNGLYVVTARAITVEIGVGSGDGFNTKAQIEYGNAVPARTAKISRTSGVGGVVEGDDTELLAALEEVSSINGYSSSLTGSNHLRVGTYPFTVSTNVISDQYKVTWVFGSLEVTPRVVHVILREQTSVYTGIEPNVSNDEWDLAGGYSLASGDERSIVVLDKADGVNAGKYDITLSCTDGNYKFVVDDGDSDENNTRAAQKYVITPAKITFSLSGDSMIYDAQSHLLDFYFSGDGVTPANHTLQGQMPATGEDGSVTFTFTDGLYTVTITYRGDFGGKVSDAEEYKNVGSYTVTIKLKNKNSFGDAGYEGNFCFEEAAGISRIAAEEYVYESSKTYEITKATIYIPDLASKAYTRDEQEADWNFANDLNTTVVPDKSNYNYTYGGGYVVYAIKMDGGEYADTNSRLGEKSHLPYYRGTYTFTLNLTNEDYRNFMFEGGRQSVTKDFEITPLEIFSRLTQPSVEYDDASRFHGDMEGGRLGAWSFNFSSTTETSVEGISYNILFTYNGLGKTGAEKADHTLIVKVGGYVREGSTDRAATQYFIDNDNEENEIKEDRMNAILEDLRAFINAGTYKYTLAFEYKNFLLRSNSGPETVETLEYEYTITPVILSVGTFANKEFNNAQQEPDITETTFTPTSEMTAARAYELLKKEYNQYSLEYDVTELLTAQNNAELQGGLPFNAGTYTVHVRLAEKGNFAFGTDAHGYVYTDSNQRFIIDPFDIATLFSMPDEHLATHAFVGELDGETTTVDSGATLYVYTYTGQEIRPELKKATIYLTADSEGIVYATPEAIGDNFSLGSFLDNTYTDIVTKNHASLVVTGKGNYTGETSMSFSIVPMKLTATIGNTSGVYGEQIVLDEKALISYGEQQPFESDNLQYEFALAAAAGQKRGENYIAGTYAITAVSANQNYKITFTGEWNKDGDAEHNGKCGIYTVERRQILVRIASQNATYSGEKPAVSSDKLHWSAISSGNGTGDPIVKGDEELQITLDIDDDPAAWNVGSYNITGTLVKDDIGKNYTVQWENGTFKITAVEITVELKPQESVYDGTIPTAKQGADWYEVTDGAAVHGETLADFIEIYIVNEDTRAFEYQLSGRLNGTENYAIKFTQSTYTIKPRAIVVTVKDAESYYGEKEVVLDSNYWFAELVNKALDGTAIIGDDNLEIQLRKEAGSSADTYNINTTWNNNGNYTVTFKSESHGGSSAIYTVKQRPITVYINDQKGVYGSITTDTLSQNEGRDAAWYVKGFSNTEDFEKELLTGNPVIEGNRLNITLNRERVVKPGKYKITGACGNENYIVTWEGGWEGDEVSGRGDAGLAGTYTIEKRAITVTVLQQRGTYGEEKRVSSNQGTAYTVECTNSGDGITFVPADSVTLSCAIDSDVNTREVAIGKYPVYLKITFGDASHADWYEITVKEDGVLQDDGRYKVENAYEVERRKLEVTIRDLSSVYGDAVKALAYERIISTNVSGDPILSDDQESIYAEILAHLKLMVAGEAYVFGGEAVIGAGTYEIVGETFISGGGSGNYEIGFTGSNEGKGVYTVVKRAITVSIQNMSSTYGDIGDYENDPAEKARVNALLQMTVATSNGTPANVTAIGEDDLAIALFIDRPQLSTSKHLKQGKYYIYATYSSEENIAANYEISVVWGEYTVAAREITVRLATNNPSSEYGDAITDQSTWGYEASLTYGDGTAIFEGDIVEFTMTTTLKEGDGVDTQPVTAELTSGDNDNGNYNVSWTPGNYRIAPRRIVIKVKPMAAVTYGTPWAPPEYTAERAEGKEGSAILHEGEVKIEVNVQNPQYSETGYIRWQEGGYLLAASVTGTAQANYSISIANISEVKYTVNKRDITVTIEDATSVYGEAIKSGNALTYQVTAGEVVTKGDTKDNLHITLSRENESRNVGSYPISGTCANTDYNVTFTGSWKEEDSYKGKCGTYTITAREIWIEVLDQTHAIYGEIYSVNGPQENATFRYAAGTPYEIVTSDEVATVIRFITDGWTISVKLDAGFYTLGAQEGSIGNYNVVVKKTGLFQVQEREIRVHINDQHGVYGEANTVAQDNYTVENVNGTGIPILKGDKLLFTFTSDASNPKQNVGSYSIIGTGSLKNYIVDYSGSFEGGQYGTYTITKRVIVVNIADQTAIYGGENGSVPIPTLSVLYTASYNGETGNAILSGDEAGLLLRFTLVYDNGSDLATSGALKAGTYAITGAYGAGNNHTNYEVSFVGSWAVEDGHHNTAGTFTVTPRSITVSLGLDNARTTSSYGETPQGPWTQKNNTMYTYALTSGTGSAIVYGDNVAFTMRTLADETSHVGVYPIVGELTKGANDNDNYNFTFTGGYSGEEKEHVGRAGIYTVTARAISAAIQAYSREYGEDVDNQTVLSQLNKDGTNGLYFTLEENWSKNGDTVKGLGVVLDCIAGATDSAQTYTITGSASNPDYSVTFTGGEGKYTITPRRVYVVILPQASVYGETIEVDQTMWYAYRNGNKATWRNGSTVDDGHVLAPGEKLDALKVRLTKRGAIDGYDYNEGNGIYGGQYAIEGDYSNTNYEVIFIGAYAKQFFENTDAFKNTANPYYQYVMFTSSDEYDYAEDPNHLLDEDYGDSGIYTVAPRKVSITLNDISGTYGGNEHTLYGEPLKKGVQLDPTIGDVWEYDYRSEQIDAGHVEYLSFYLGGKFGAEEGSYLVVGDYPVVAYWGLGLDENSRMRDWNYEITFHGRWNGGALTGDWTDTEGHTPQRDQAGKFTVNNATIGKHGDWYEAVDYILEHDAEPYIMSVNKSMIHYDTTIRGKWYLVFQGDVTEASSITYGRLYFNKDSNSKDGVPSQTDYEKDPETGAPKVNQAGYWILEVTVTAQYHEDATFDLVYHITPDLIVLTLKEDASYGFTYGKYSYDDRGTGTQFSELERALKEWLLGEDRLSVVTAMRVGGKDVSAEELGGELNDLFLNEGVVVSIYKMTSNCSTGGYLNAGRYLVTISGGSNLEITFVHDYEIVTCNPKTVTATWTELTGTATRSEYEGADLFTVTYDAKQHTLDPAVSGAMDGDRITDYAVASYRFVDGASATPLGYGYYVCRVTSRALGGADGSNYAVENDLHAYVFVQKCEVTVQIKDKAAHTYGEAEEEFTTENWALDDGTPMAPGEQRSVLGVVLTREPGKDVGSYKVKGTFSNENYNVTWKGSWNKEDDPDRGTCGTFTIVPRHITVTLLNKTVTYGAERPEGDDLASDITLWYATYDYNPRAVAIMQGDDIHLTMKIDYASADLTATGYLKAKSYTVTASWENGNYIVTFESERTPSLPTSLYIVEKCPLRVSLFDATPTEYGYDRPGSIAHAFTGFTAGDKAYFEEHPEALFIRFFFYDPGKSMELSPAAAYDPVGTYAVCGEITDENDSIGANYLVNFVGSWDNNLYPELVQHAGVYLVTPRTISIIIHSVSSEYGEIAYVPIELQTGSSLVGTDTLPGLGIRYKTDAYYDRRTNKPGVYPIEYDSIANPNYRVSGAVAIDATYTVLKRKVKITAYGQSSEYGDDHTPQSVKDVHWTVSWVTEDGELREGPGIAYEDDALNNLRLICSGVRASTDVGNYPLSAVYDTDDCYEIVDEEYADYRILPREIVVTVESYRDWEYGEDHAARFRNQINVRERGFYFERKNGNGTAIAFSTDPINNFRLALDVTMASHVGSYPITCVYNDSNYSVAIKGDYMDEDGNVIGGTYTINPRAITVVLENQSGEYGDDHTPVNLYGVTWKATHMGGGVAIIGTDDLQLIFTTNATKESGVAGNPYNITATCGNGDYAVTFIDGIYTVTPRKLTASVYGESEYGDPLQEMNLVLSRTTAGMDSTYGIMPWDESFLSITASCDVQMGSPVGHYPVTYTITGNLNADKNYEIVNSNEGEYVVLPREIVVNIGSVTQVYGDPVVGASDLAYTVSRANGKEGEAILNNEIAIVLRVRDFSPNAGTYVIDIQAIDNANYRLTVNTGEYTIGQKQISVHIDDKSSEYGSSVEALTVGEIEGLLEGDDLGLSLRVEWGDELEWHNVGDYAIVGTYDNLNYLVSFDGSWLARDAVGGTYTVYKATNVWLKEYSGDGTVVQGNGLGEGEGPTAKFGEAVIRYYYDEACTQEIEGDISEFEAGVYYAKATVGDTMNYSGVENVFVIEVLSSFIYPNGALDVTLFVSIFASQFLIGICALLFVRRRKNKKNQLQSEGTK